MSNKMANPMVNFHAYVFKKIYDFIYEVLKILHLFTFLIQLFLFRVLNVFDIFWLYVGYILAFDYNNQFLIHVLNN